MRNKEKKELQLKELETLEKIARSFLLVSTGIAVLIYFLVENKKSLSEYIEPFGGNLFLVLNGFLFAILFYASISITYFLYISLFYRFVSYKTLLKGSYWKSFLTIFIIFLSLILFFLGSKLIIYFVKSTI